MNIDLFKLTQLKKEASMSSLFTINVRDSVRAFVLAVLYSVISAVYEIVKTGTLPTMEQFQTIAITALGVALAYILKNFLTNNADQMLKPDVKG
jgi:hypothetical protein